MPHNFIMAKSGQREGWHTAMQFAEGYKQTHQQLLISSFQGDEYTLSYLI